MVINTKNPDESVNVENVAEIEDRISALKDRIKEMIKREKNKNADEALKIIEEILDYNESVPRTFPLASESDKGKSEPTPEESIVERVKLRRQRSAEIAKKEKEISLELFGRYFGYSSPSVMYKALNETKNPEENRAEINTIENSLTNLIETLKSSPTSDAKKKMLCRFPITLARLNAGINSEKVKKEIRQLLYSLYRSKKFTKTV